MANKKLTANPVPRHGGKVLAIAIGVSLIVHLMSYLNLSVLVNRIGRKPITMTQQPIKINVVEKKKPEGSASDQDDKKIVEVKQEATETPENAKYKSFQNHRTEKETKLRDIPDSKKAADAGGSAPKKRQIVKSDTPKPPTNEAPKPKLEISNSGSLEIRAQERRKRYKELMPHSSELASLVDQGYQQYIDDELELGDRIDINTTEYRYMGYFTNMRKAIELVWNYPIDAARKGMQGDVQVEFVISKEGNISRVKIVRSSGYKLLDDAIIEALRLASPFSPLPEDFGVRKRVTGTFRYILSSYYAGGP